MEPVDYQFWLTASLILLCVAFATLAVIDHHRYLLPDAITLPMVGFGLLVSFFFSTFASFADSVIGCVAGYFSIRFVHDFEMLMKNSAGIGLGDAKFFAALGAWFGWRALPYIIVVAAIATLIIYFKRKEKPFGVGLAIAATGFGATNLLLFNSY